jgi:hypothetical protein
VGDIVDGVVLVGNDDGGGVGGVGRRGDRVAGSNGRATEGRGQGGGRATVAGLGGSSGNTRSACDISKNIVFFNMHMTITMR